MNQENTRQTSASIIRNIKFGALTWLLPLGLSFIATPVIIDSLGKSDYGIYALILGFIGYSFTFNLGRAITKYIAEYRVSGESGKIGDIISASFFLNAAVGLFGVLSICLLADWLVRDVFMIEPESQDKTIAAFYIASGIIFLTMLSQLLSSVLQGIQRFDVYSKIVTGTGVALLVGNLILALLGFGLIDLLYWNLAVLIANCATFAVAAKRLLPEFRISLRFELKTLGLVARYSSGILAYQVLANIMLLFERGWITQRLGSESLTYYVVPLALGIYLHGFISSLLLVVFPLASELNDDRPKLLRLYTKATSVVLVLVLFVITSMIIQSRIFLELWLGADFAQQSALLLILHILSFGLMSILTVSWQMTEGLGYPQFNAALMAVSTTIGIVLMVILINDLGNTGVAVARLSGFATICLSIFIVERWFFKKVQVRFWLGVAGTLGLAAAAAAVVEFAINALLPITWPSFILSLFLGGLAYALVLWVLDFVKADEKLLIKEALGR